MKRGFNKSRFLLLRGKEGIVEGESFCIYFGQSVVVGRSSSCHFSLKRCKKFIDSKGKDVLNDSNFRKISRRHFRISYCHPSMVEIEDLSQNGTFVDGKRIDKIVITDLKEKHYEISFGEKEVILLTGGN